MQRIHFYISQEIDSPLQLDVLRIYLIGAKTRLGNRGTPALLFRWIPLLTFFKMTV